MSGAATSTSARVRFRQIALVTVLVISSLLLPLAAFHDAAASYWALSLVTWALTPLCYAWFARGVERAVRELGGHLQEKSGFTGLALATAVPLFGSFLEIILLWRLARATGVIAVGARREGVVLTLAVLRLFANVGVLAVMSWLSVMQLVSADIVVAAHPIVSLALLAVITQIIVQPILDHAPATSTAKLGAAGATSPMAVSTTTTTTTGE